MSFIDISQVAHCNNMRQGLVISPIVKWLSPPTLNRVSEVRTLVGEVLFVEIWIESNNLFLKIFMLHGDPNLMIVDSLCSSAVHSNIQFLHYLLCHRKEGL